MDAALGFPLSPVFEWIGSIAFVIITLRLIWGIAGSDRSSGTDLIEV